MATTQVPVFDIPELFLKILLELPMRDLLLSHRVSRHWRSVSSSSGPLLRAQFFLPIIHPSRKTKPRLNPLLVHSFPCWFTNQDAIDDATGMMIPLSIHDETLDKLDLAQSARIRNAYLRPTASWRRMLVVQVGIFLGPSIQL